VAAGGGKRRVPACADASAGFRDLRGRTRGISKTSGSTRGFRVVASHNAVIQQIALWRRRVVRLVASRTTATVARAS